MWNVKLNDAPDQEAGVSHKHPLKCAQINQETSVPLATTNSQENVNLFYST